MEVIDRDVPGPRRDYVGYGRNPPRVVWPNEARVAVNFIINYEEGSEVAMPVDGKNEAALGEIPYAMPSTHRDLAMESVYEYGSRAGIWRLQRLFDKQGIKVTLFAAAVAIERNLAVGRWIRDEGHEPCSHGWRWEEMWHLSREEEKAHMAAAIKSFEDTCGTRPLGWYCRYGPSVHTRELIIEDGGFVYDSDAYNDDLPYYVDVRGTRHLIVPYTFTYNDARFAMAPGYGSPSDFFDLLRRGLDFLWDEGATHPRIMNIGLHPRLAGQAGRTSAVQEFIDYAQSKGGVWFARRIDIANWWHEHHGEFVS